MTYFGACSASQNSKRMKVSLKLQDQPESRQCHHHPPLLLRAKIPITIFNHPFLSHFSTTTAHPSDLSLSLSTNSPSFPSLKLSYTAAAAAAAPLSLTLKSGTGLFGSPINSPIAISAHFSFNPSNPASPNPTFSLFFKPKLGSFSLRKSTSSHPEPSNEFAPNSLGFIPPANKTDNSSEKINRNSLFQGFQLAARTEMPVSKRTALNFRWWVNFAGDQTPVLRINKIGLHRIDGAEKDEAKAEAVKGMCCWMKSELDDLTRVNGEMKVLLQEMRAGKEAMRFAESAGSRTSAEKENDNGRKQAKKAAMASVASPSQWRRATVEENDNGRRLVKKKSNLASDVENELQRAIEAAATAAAAASPSTSMDKHCNPISLNLVN